MHFRRAPPVVPCSQFSNSNRLGSCSEGRARVLWSAKRYLSGKSSLDRQGITRGWSPFLWAGSVVMLLAQSIAFGRRRLALRFQARLMMYIITGARAFPSELPRLSALNNSDNQYRYSPSQHIYDRIPLPADAVLDRCRL